MIKIKPFNVVICSYQEHNKENLKKQMQKSKYFMFVYIPQLISMRSCCGFFFISDTFYNSVSQKISKYREKNKNWYNRKMLK